MQHIKTCGASIALQSAVFGDFLEVEVPFCRLTADEALELVDCLIKASQRLRELQVQPVNRVLPLSEEYALALSDSCVGPSQAPTVCPVGVRVSEVAL